MTEELLKEEILRKKSRFFLDGEDQNGIQHIINELLLSERQIRALVAVIAQYAYECFLKAHPLDLTEEQENFLLLLANNKEQYKLLRLVCAKQYEILRFFLLRNKGALLRNEGAEEGGATSNDERRAQESTKKELEKKELEELEKKELEKFIKKREEFARSSCRPSILQE